MINSYRDSCNLRQLVVQHLQERTSLRSIVVGTCYDISLAEMKYYFGNTVFYLNSICNSLRSIAVRTCFNIFCKWSTANDCLIYNSLRLIAVRTCFNIFANLQLTAIDSGEDVLQHFCKWSTANDKRGVKSSVLRLGCI